MWIKRTFPLAGYSDVTLMYGTYGRVYIRHYQYGLDRYEVCSDGFSNTDGETLCRSKGYSYSSFSTYVNKYHLMNVSNVICVMKWHCFVHHFHSFLQYHSKEPLPHSGHQLLFIWHFKLHHPNTKLLFTGSTSLLLWLVQQLIFQKIKSPFNT